MHPAFSVIVFTTASGAGYGLLVWFALFSLGAPDWIDRPLALTALVLGLALVTVGLTSSTLHLGRPERAWRALSQWRSSWLSREGVAAIVAYAPAGLLALAWMVSPQPGSVAVLLALLIVPTALVTTYCTAMIYASLKTVHQWHNRLVVPNYYALGLFTGALLFSALAQLFGRGTIALGVATLAAGAAALALKLAYWRFIDSTASASTAESATGLGKFGTVRLFEAPHTEENYLMREMGFSIARKHAAKLRRITLIALFAAPLALTLIDLLTGGVIATLASVAVASAAAGVLTERWLFFAEAKHTVMLFYGARAA